MLQRSPSNYLISGNTDFSALDIQEVVPWNKIFIYIFRENPHDSEKTYV